jgi:hypothetical protein
LPPLQIQEKISESAGRKYGENGNPFQGKIHSRTEPHHDIKTAVASQTDKVDDDGSGSGNDTGRFHYTGNGGFRRWNSFCKSVITPGEGAEEVKMGKSENGNNSRISLQFCQTVFAPAKVARNRGTSSALS